MFSGRVKSNALRIKLVILLSFIALFCFENDSSPQEGVYYKTSDTHLGHYLSSLPGNINLDSVINNQLFLQKGSLLYTENPFEYYNQHTKHKKTGRSLVHKCKYCMRRYLRNKGSNRHSAHRRKSNNARKQQPRKSYLSRGTFEWPIDSDKFWISCYFGRRARGRMHNGLDLAAIGGTPVRASAPGIVEMAMPAGTFGNMVLIRHKNGYKTRYAHLRDIAVTRGSFVPRGKLIGRVGHTGRVMGKTGDHLHFEILANNKPINPMYLLA